MDFGRLGRSLTVCGEVGTVSGPISAVYEGALAVSDMFRPFWMDFQTILTLFVNVFIVSHEILSLFGRPLAAFGRIWSFAGGTLTTFG